MVGFAKRERQRIVDEYLNATGRNDFIPGEFLDWLKDKPEHEAHSVFYNVSDEKAARQYRVQLVRSWVSGLRITVHITETKHHVGRVQVGEYQTPAMLSPTRNRKHGGGYQSMDGDPEMVAEYRRQAAMALEGWIERFGGAVEMSGGSVEPIKEIIDLLIDVADAAA